MHECVCVALSRVCLLLLLCVCERVFYVSVHAYVCVDVDGWVRWRFFFATSNLKSVCSLSLNILLVYLCVCVYWFVCVVLIPTQQHSVSGYFLRRCCCYFASVGVHDRFQKSWQFGSVCSLRSRSPLSKRGNNGHGEPFHRRKCAAGGQTEVDQSFFCFVL